MLIQSINLPDYFNTVLHIILNKRMYFQLKRNINCGNISIDTYL